MTVDQFDTIVGYSDYQVVVQEIDDDCSPDDCEGNWWFLQSSARGEIYAVRLGYYKASEF